MAPAPLWWDCSSEVLSSSIRRGGDRLVGAGQFLELPGAPQCPVFCQMIERRGNSGSGIGQALRELLCGSSTGPCLRTTDRSLGPRYRNGLPHLNRPTVLTRELTGAGLVGSIAPLSSWPWPRRDSSTWVFSDPPYNCSAQAKEWPQGAAATQQGLSQRSSELNSGPDGDLSGIAGQIPARSHHRTPPQPVPPLRLTTTDARFPLDALRHFRRMTLPI